ncbi:transposase [Nonomuraea sp. 10N515B]|uniref:transposase n=1 Tax=Nonomuraea sp. 10N515B TaxID=3457422 RepID=UPI003FCC3052
MHGYRRVLTAGPVFTTIPESPPSFGNTRKPGGPERTGEACRDQTALSPEYRHGHGALCSGLNHRRIDVEQLREVLARLPLPRWPDGRIVLAVDVSPLLRSDAPCSAERLYSFVAALEMGRSSWTAPLDVVRLRWSPRVRASRWGWPGRIRRRAWAAARWFRDRHHPLRQG